jgi:hypothetical protein
MAMGAAAATPAKAALVGGNSDICNGRSTGYTLRTIIRGGCNVEIGDKIFSNFNANTSSFGDSSVSGLGDWVFAEVNNGNAGIGFNLLGILQANGDGTRPSDIADLALSYTVSVKQGVNNLITGAYAAINGQATGDGVIGLTEDILQVGIGGPTDIILRNNVSSKAISFAGLSKIDVTKNIRAVATGVGSEAHISAITDTYSQTPIPTPALLPGLVGMGIAAMRRQRKQTAELA